MGVDGLLGAATATTAERAGHQVRVWKVGTGPDAIREEARGCEAVIHAVTPDMRWFRDPRDPERFLVEGCRLAVEASRVSGAKLLAVSSFLALGPADGGMPDVNVPPPARRFLCGVERAAWLADRMVRHLTDEGFPAVLLYPGLVYGPGYPDSGNPLVTILSRIAGGRVAWMPPCDERLWSFAWVDDVASALVTAVHRARPGSVYALGGDNRSVADCLGSFRSAGGGTPPAGRRSYRIAAATGRFRRWRAALHRAEPGLTDEMVRLLRHDWPVASGLAQNDLGLRVTPLEAGISRVAAWLREDGPSDRSGPAGGRRE
jgi:nucleoside-diphosphate-sugar epimerase